MRIERDETRNKNKSLRFSNKNESTKESSLSERYI